MNPPHLTPEDSEDPSDSSASNNTESLGVDPEESQKSDSQKKGVPSEQGLTSEQEQDLKPSTPEPITAELEEQQAASAEDAEEDSHATLPDAVLLPDDDLGEVHSAGAEGGDAGGDDTGSDDAGSEDNTKLAEKAWSGSTPEKLSASSVAASEAAHESLDSSSESEPEVIGRAVARGVRISARKARLVADLIRHQTVQQAQSHLTFTHKKAADIILKLLGSALANIRHKAELKGTSVEHVEELYIKIHVDEGPTAKRWRPRAQGRAYTIRKRTCSIVLELVTDFA